MDYQEANGILNTNSMICVHYHISKNSRKIDIYCYKSWGHGDLNAGHRTPSPVGYQATLWPRMAHPRMQRWHIRISHGPVTNLCLLTEPQCYRTVIFFCGWVTKGAEPKNMCQKRGPKNPGPLGLFSPLFQFLIILGSGWLRLRIQLVDWVL